MGRRTLKIAPDSNVLIRGVVRDDLAQADVADRLMRTASSIYIALSCLCEFVWVLRRVYRLPNARVHAAILSLYNTHNVVLDRPAVEAGLDFL